MLSSTVINDSIAIPHSLTDGINRPFVFVLILNSPIKWDEKHKVQLIFLFGIPKRKKYLINEFQKVLQTFIDSPELIAKITDADNLKLFFELVEKYQR